MMMMKIIPNLPKRLTFPLCDSFDMIFLPPLPAFQEKDNVIFPVDDKIDVNSDYADYSIIALQNAGIKLESVAPIQPSRSDVDAAIGVLESELSKKVNK